MMPEFQPRHVPAEVDAFLSGYLAAAEWTFMDCDDEGREVIPARSVRGWSARAKRLSAKDCAKFCETYAYPLDCYCKLSGRDMSSAGHDFWLSRNGHGAGFFARGNGDVFDYLQVKAGHCGTRDVYRTDSGWLDIG